MNCRCALWAQGRIHGKPFRRSLGTRSRQRAFEIIRTLLNGETEAKADAPPAAPALCDAIRDYLHFPEHNKRLKASTLVSYRDTFKFFGAFCAERRFRAMDELNLAVLQEFQRSRDVTPKTAHKEFQHLKGFCSFAVDHGWIKENLAKRIKLPKADGVSTLAFEEAKARRILAACDRLRESNGVRGGYACYALEQIELERSYAKALTSLLLETGLRISDAVNLERGRIFTDKKGQTRFRIRVMKTGVPLTLPLSKHTALALTALPRVSDRLHFWKGGDETQFATACDRAR